MAGQPKSLAELSDLGSNLPCLTTCVGRVLMSSANELVRVFFHSCGYNRHQGLSRDLETGCPKLPFLKCHGNYVEAGKRQLYMSEREIFKNYLTKKFGYPEGLFLRVWVFI